MWETIDSAPKDGSVVILLSPAGEHRIGLGYFCDEERFERGVSRGKSQYWSIISSVGFVGDPTHWIALPQAPDLKPISADVAAVDTTATAGASDAL